MPILGLLELRALRLPRVQTAAIGLTVLGPEDRNQYVLPPVGVPPPSSLDASRPLSS